MRALLAILFIGLAACGDIPSDATPVTMPNDPVGGIYRVDEDGNVIGTFGSPSHGGHADGKEIRCAPGTEPPNTGGVVDLPSDYRLEHPYPNPSYGDSFSIRFRLSCKTDVTIEVVEATPSPWIIATMPMNASVAMGQSRTVWKSKRSDLPPGIHSSRISLFNPDKPVNGFFRVYVIAGKFKAWRDVGLFFDPSHAPDGLGFGR